MFWTSGSHSLMKLLLAGAVGSSQGSAGCGVHFCGPLGGCWLASVPLHRAANRMSNLREDWRQSPHQKLQSPKSDLK